MKTYSEKLRDPRWQKKRLEILEQNKFTCQLCKDTETELHIHHFSYIKGKEPWEYDNDSLTTYCKHCHKLIEETKKGDFVIMNIKKSIGEYVFLTCYCSYDEKIGGKVNFFRMDLNCEKIDFVISVSSQKLKDLMNFE